MILDNAIKIFTERIDREAISSIEEVSNELGLKVAGFTIKTFNINESFNKFATYLEQYGEYKATYKDNPKASPREVIHESTKTFMENDLFKIEEIKYDELPNFVSSYVEGCNHLLETVSKVQSSMRDCEIDMESIGDVCTFADMFMEKMDQMFYESMDKILWASGYNSKKALAKKPEVIKPAKPVFL